MNLLSTSPLWQQYGLAIIRLFLGGFMIYHGWEVFDESKMNAYLQWDQFKDASASSRVYVGKASELTGGLLLTIGLFTRWAALLIAGTMVYVTFFIGTGKIWYEDQHPFMFVLLALVFFFTGPGKYSVDHFLWNKKTAA